MIARETQKTCRPLDFGVALTLLGGFFLLTRLVDFGLFTQPLLGGLFIATGILRRTSAYFIPGGISAGIGLGNYLTDAAPFVGTLSEEAEGGVFLLSFALGWVGVFALSLGFGQERNTWALIPALVMKLSAGSC